MLLFEFCYGTNDESPSAMRWGFTQDERKEDFRIFLASMPRFKEPGFPKRMPDIRLRIPQGLEGLIQVESIEFVRSYCLTSFMRSDD